MTLRRREPERPSVTEVHAYGPGSIAVGGNNYGGLSTHVTEVHAPREVRWPHRVGVVPRPASCFQAREGVEDAIRAARSSGSAPAVFVLTGLGGVGKTQAAARFAEHEWGAGRLDLLMWVPAVSRQSVLADYAGAAVDLAVAGADGTDIEQDGARFLAWLATTGRRWLLVLDDLENPAVLKGLWPPARQSGTTFVTTRLRGTAVRPAGHRMVDVDAFSHGTAVAYLRERFGDRPELADAVDGVASDLGHLPLALSQASAFMLDEEISCARYRERFSDIGRRIVDLVPDVDELPDDYSRTVSATLSLSVDAADAGRPVGLAKPVLQLASVLSPAGMPESLFLTVAARNWLAFAGSIDAGIDVDADMARSSLRRLQRLNLVRINDDVVTVHEMVQRCVREDLSEEFIADVGWAASDALLETWPSVDRDAAHTRMLNTNVESVRRHGGDSLLAPEPHSILFRAANSLGLTGQITGAVAAYQGLVERLSGLLGPDDPATLLAGGNLAHWRGISGDVVGAAATYRLLLSDQTRVMGGDHADTFAIRHNYAQWLAAAGDGSAATKIYAQLYDDAIHALGPDHPNTLTIRGSWARCRALTGDLAGAVTALEELLSDQTRLLGPDHLEVLTTRSNLAKWRSEEGAFGLATAELEGLLADLAHVLSADHPLTMIVRSNLLWIQNQAGAGPSLEEYRDLIEDQQRALDPTHRSLMITRSNLAFAVGERGNAGGAVAIYEDLLTELLSVSGRDHIDTIQIRRNLAHWREKAGDHIGALADYETVLAVSTRTLGPDHEVTLTTRLNLAGQRALAGYVPAAIKDHENLLSDALSASDPDNSLVFAALNNLAYWRGKAGDAVASAADYRRLLELQSRALGDIHPDTRATRYRVAITGGETGDAAGAVIAFESLVADERRLLGDDHPDTLAARAALAGMRGLAGEPETAGVPGSPH